MFTKFELFTHTIEIIERLEKPATSAEIRQELIKLDKFKDLKAQSLNGTLSHPKYCDILERIPSETSKGKTTYRVRPNYQECETFKQLEGYNSQVKGN